MNAVKTNMQGREAHGHTHTHTLFVVSFSDVRGLMFGWIQRVGSSFSSSGGGGFQPPSSPAFGRSIVTLCVSVSRGSPGSCARVCDSVCPLHTLTVKLQQYNSGCCSGVPAVLA